MRRYHPPSDIGSILFFVAQLQDFVTTQNDMDNIAVIILLFIVVLILSGIVLPIVALVIAIHTKKKLAAQLARLNSTSALNPDAVQQIRTTDLAPLAKAIQQLDSRIGKIEATLAGSIPFPDVELTEQQPSPRIEQPTAPPITEPVSEPTTLHIPPPPPPPFDESQPVSPLPFITPQTPARQTGDIESIIGRRLVGWIAIGLIL